jgi:hypothetical protein
LQWKEEDKLLAASVSFFLFLSQIVIDGEALVLSFAKKNIKVVFQRENVTQVTSAEGKSYISAIIEKYLIKFLKFVLYKK